LLGSTARGIYYSQDKWYPGEIQYKGSDSSWYSGGFIGTHNIQSPGWNEAAKRGIPYSKDLCNAMKDVTVNWGDYCYIPFRVLNNEIQFSDDGWNHAWFNSDKLGYVKLYLYDWYDTEAKKLIGYWNANRVTRRNTLSDDIKKLAANAKTYVDNLALYTTAKAGEIDYASEITKNKASIETYEKTITDLNTAVTTAQTQKATETTTRDKLVTEKAAVKAEYDTNALQITTNTNTIKELKGQGETKTVSKDTFTAEATTRLGLYTAAIEWITENLPEEAANMTQATTNLKAGKLEDCLALIRAVQTVA